MPVKFHFNCYLSFSSFWKIFPYLFCEDMIIALVLFLLYSYLMITLVIFILFVSCFTFTFLIFSLSLCNFNRNGAFHSNYEGGRSTPDILAFMKKLVLFKTLPISSTFMVQFTNFLYSRVIFINVIIVIIFYLTRFKNDSLCKNNILETNYFYLNYVRYFD